MSKLCDDYNSTQTAGLLTRLTRIFKSTIGGRVFIFLWGQLLLSRLGLKHIVIGLIR